MRARIHRSRIPQALGFLILLTAVIGSGPALAEDSVAAVMARMKSTSATRIAYRETRTLELFEKPQEASGLFYGMPPDLLIKEQLTPSREIMGILKDHYYYFNPESGVHHSRARDPDDPMNLHIIAFQALANGDWELMTELYNVAFFTEPGHWYMILSDKNESRSLLRITVSGSAGQAADKMEIHEADGERSVYRLEKDSEGESIKSTIQRLEAELTGQ